MKKIIAIILVSISSLHTIHASDKNIIDTLISVELKKLSKNYKMSLAKEETDGAQIIISKKTYESTKLFLGLLKKSTDLDLKKQYFLSKLYSELQWEEGTIGIVGEKKDLDLVRAKVIKLKSNISSLNKIQ